MPRPSNDALRRLDPPDDGSAPEPTVQPYRWRVSDEYDSPVRTADGLPVTPLQRPSGSRHRTALVLLLYVAGLVLFFALLGWLTGAPFALLSN